MLEGDALCTAPRAFVAQVSGVRAYGGQGDLVLTAHCTQYKLQPEQLLRFTIAGVDSSSETMKVVDMQFQRMASRAVSAAADTSMQQ